MDGQTQDLLQLNKPTKFQYVVLEDVRHIGEDRILIVIKAPDDYELEVGAGSAEVIIPDNSVGQKHATLKYNLQKNELILYTFDSPFRSQVLMQRPVRLIEHKPLVVLNRNSLIKIELKREKRNYYDLFCGCLRGKLGPNLRDGRLLYRDCKEYLPSDLQVFEQEDRDRPPMVVRNRTLEKIRKTNSLNLMPFRADCYNKLQMKRINLVSLKQRRKNFQL